jgi:hypothetical protein
MANSLMFDANTVRSHFRRYNKGDWRNWTGSSCGSTFWPDAPWLVVTGAALQQYPLASGEADCLVGVPAA